MTKNQRRKKIGQGQVSRTTSSLYARILSTVLCSTALISSLNFAHAVDRTNRELHLNADVSVNFPNHFTLHVPHLSSNYTGYRRVVSYSYSNTTSIWNDDDALSGLVIGINAVEPIPYDEARFIPIYNISATTGSVTSTKDYAAGIVFDTGSPDAPNLNASGVDSGKLDLVANGDVATFGSRNSDAINLYTKGGKGHYGRTHHGAEGSGVAGGDGGKGGSISTRIYGNLSTKGNNSDGMFLQSGGGDGGNGGGSGGTGDHGGRAGSGGAGGQISALVHGDVTTLGDDSVGLHLLTEGGRGATGGSNGNHFHGHPGRGGTGGVGGDIDLSIYKLNDKDETIATKISTSGADADAIRLQSIGSNGGAGGKLGFAFVGSGGRGASGGIGGDVDADIKANISTLGDHSFGIFAQSLGGSGGKGGSGSALVGLGANGGVGAHGGDVELDLEGAILTYGFGSMGINLQSIGGGGGSAGNLAGLVSIGGDGASGGDGGKLSLSLAEKSFISTSGHGAIGLLAETIGGGGGNGGHNAGLAAIGGHGGAGGQGGEIIAHLGGVPIATYGDHASGAIFQSIGGGGGTGGISAGLVSIGGKGGDGGHGGTIAVSTSSEARSITYGDFSTALQLRSTGGGGGHGGSAVAFGIGGSAAIGGAGGKGGAGGAIHSTILGDHSTMGDHASGIHAQSIGGGGGTGGYALSASIGVKGDFSLAVGGSGGEGGKGGEIDLRVGSATTSGSHSQAVVAQSIGGGGGHGGTAISLSGAIGASGSTSVALSVGGSGGRGGSGGAINLSTTETSKYQTTGAHSNILVAQSIGGGGGNGGHSVAGSLSISGGAAAGIAVGVGGSAGLGGTGDDVQLTIANENSFRTYGDHSNGVLAQSIGGGGGNGGSAIAGSLTIGSTGAKSVDLAVGGSGGHGGSAGQVSTKIGDDLSLTTSGAFSTGISAQSIGGGGGNGGFSATGSLTASPENAGSLGISIGGHGGYGGNAKGTDVSIGSGTLSTSGEYAHGILAQAIGGGGGTGGMAIAGSVLVSESDTSTLNTALGGQGGTGGHGGKINVKNNGTSLVSGSFADGILAQSIGGGGGAGGVSIAGSYSRIKNSGKKGPLASAISIGGGGGDGGDSSTVVVANYGDIIAMGHGGSGIKGQSIGGGGGSGGNAIGISLQKIANSKDISSDEENDDEDDEDDKSKKAANKRNTIFSIGGNGGGGGNASTVSIKNDAQILTTNLFSSGVIAQSIGGGGGSGGSATNFTALKPLLKASVKALTGIDVDETIKKHFGSRVEEKFADKDDDSDSPKKADNESGVAAIYHSLGRDPIDGKGGNGGDAGDVKIDGSGTIITTGYGSLGILAQSVAGGGGHSHVADKANTLETTLGVGSGDSGKGGSVNVSQNGDVITHGSFASAIVAQSIGGGGGQTTHLIVASEDGNDEKSSTISLGGSTGKGGHGGAVQVDLPNQIVTSGDMSSAVVAQSIGGGGGQFGGSVQNMETTVSFGAGGTLVTQQAGGHAGNVTISDDSTSASVVATIGNASHGIVAQSVGGGGGFAAFSTSAKQSDDVRKSWGSGGDTTIDLASTQISTIGNHSYGIWAQSIGGGGGALISDGGATKSVLNINGTGAGGNITIKIGKASSVLTLGEDAHAVSAMIGGGAATDDAVDIENNNIELEIDGSVEALGKDANAIHARINDAFRDSGKINISVAKSGLLFGGSGEGAAINLSASETLNTPFTLKNYGKIYALSDTALVSDHGGIIENFGVASGSIKLNNDSDQAITALNYGTLNSGRSMDFGDRGVLYNNGVFAIGSQNDTIAKTYVKGNFEQNSDGKIAANIDFRNGEADHLEINGSAILGGKIEVLPTWLVPSTEVVEIAEATAMTDLGVLDFNKSLIADYNVTITGNSLNVALDEVDFNAAAGSGELSDNAEQVASELQKLWDANDVSEIGDELAALANEYSGTELSGDLERFATDHPGQSHGAILKINNQFKDAMHSCNAVGYGYSVLAEDECAWVKPMAGQFKSNGFSHTLHGFVGGVQHQLADDQFLGLAGGLSHLSGSSANDSLSGEAFHLGAIGKQFVGDTLFALTGKLSYGRFETTRLAGAMSGATAIGEHEIFSFGLRGRVSRAFEYGNWFAKFDTNADLTYSHAKSHDETGAGALSLSVDDFSHVSFAVTPRLTLGHTFQMDENTFIRPSLNFGATLDANADYKVQSVLRGAGGTKANFSQTVENDPVTLHFGAGIQVLKSGSYNLDVNYEGSWSDSTQRHTASSKFSLKF